MARLEDINRTVSQWDPRRKSSGEGEGIAAAGGGAGAAVKRGGVKLADRMSDSVLVSGLFLLDYVRCCTSVRRHLCLCGI